MSDLFGNPNCWLSHTKSHLHLTELFLNIPLLLHFSDIMNAPALSFNKVEKVGRIIEVLRNETFCGFPVVNAKGRVSKNLSLSVLLLTPQLTIFQS